MTALFLYLMKACWGNYRPTASQALAQIKKIRCYTQMQWVMPPLVDQIRFQTRQLNLPTMGGQQQHQQPGGLHELQAGSLNTGNGMVQPSTGAHHPQNAFNPAAPMHGGMDGQQQAGNHLAMPQGNQLPQPGMLNPGAPVNMQTIEQAQRVRAHMHDLEGQLNQLHDARAGMSDKFSLSRLSQLQDAIQRQRAMVQQLAARINKLRSQHTQQMPSTLVNAMNPTMGQSIPPHSSSPPLHPRSANVGQPGWSPPGSQQPFPGQPTQRQPTPHFQGMSQPHLPNMQPSPRQIPPHPQLQSPPQISARTTPHPNLIPPQPIVSQPIASAQPMMGATHMDQIQWVMPPPVDQIKFSTAYRTKCNQKAIQHDKRLMEIDHRPVDHYEVMREGGRKQVTQKELWPVIGGRLGFVAFPGNGHEPAKCLQLQQRPGMAANGQSVRPAQRPADVATMQLMLQHAHSTVQQMRAAGLQEELIALIERHRTQLQQSEQQRAQMPYSTRLRA
ncbi:hypothetical protein PUNSTDRAFT_47211 [Punctularia strigosozonata HHB-11173 SS5]|uniref:ARID domain-containing protein n=1 Tax=Punctularia strigosozonata (strain HHB-11173) TaxID=741275 RepID=R7S541_PUNST|nr:uncharacterized protein PUNSTDRAFT_47211 [Punctularia strigosozonata HHB-11173 SS5]EIN04972.1 hypothetical protein PUNSTDRAFT_47211 [Punctularia strigosozonata HHB-11173 SS5]